MCVCVVLTKRLFVCRVVQSLLQNMNRYPEDRLSIYQCLKGLGEHHGQFVELLVEPLLGMLHVDLRFLGTHRAQRNL